MLEGRLLGMILVRRAGSIASNVHARRMFQISVQSPVCLQSCVPYACVRSHAQMLEIVKCKHIVSISRFLHSAFICCNYARTLATTAACCKAGDATGARIRAHVVIECDKWLPGGAGASARARGSGPAPASAPPAEPQAAGEVEEPEERRCGRRSRRCGRWRGRRPAATRMGA